MTEGPTNQPTKIFGGVTSLLTLMSFSLLVGWSFSLSVCLNFLKTTGKLRFHAPFRELVLQSLVLSIIVVVHLRVNTLLI